MVVESQIQFFHCPSKQHKGLAFTEGSKHGPHPSSGNVMYVVDFVDHNDFIIYGTGAINAPLPTKGYLDPWLQRLGKRENSITT